MLPLRSYWRGGFAILHSLPHAVDALSTFMGLFRDSACIYLGSGPTPVVQFDRLWRAYGPFMDNIYAADIITHIGVDLDLVVSWLLSPSKMSRCLSVRNGSPEIFQLCVLLKEAFFKLPKPLLHMTSILIWGDWTKWPIADQDKLKILAMSNVPLLTKHNHFLLTIHTRLPNLNIGAVNLRIQPRNVSVKLSVIPRQ